MSKKRTMSELIGAECDSIKKLLIAKNKAYGNSVAEPVRIFSKVPPLDQINVRIDDKLSRLSKGSDFADEDTVHDLIGYLILSRAVTRFLSKENSSEDSEL